MRKHPSSFRFALHLLAGGLLLCGAAYTAQAQTVITSLPYDISSGGTYVLDQNLNSNQTDGRLITVNASNVTIDFQGHYIAGPVGNTGQTTIGVYAHEQSNLTVKNGTIAFCAAGVYIDGDGTTTTNNVNHRIENMRHDLLLRFRHPDFRRPRQPREQLPGVPDRLHRGERCLRHRGQGLRDGCPKQRGEHRHRQLGQFNRHPGRYRQLHPPNTVSNSALGVRGGKFQDNLTSGCTLPYSNGIDAGGNN